MNIIVYNGLRYASFNDWSKSGFRIVKGSKSHRYDQDGVPLFSENQVRYKTKKITWIQGGPDDHHQYDDSGWGAYEDAFDRW